MKYLLAIDQGTTSSRVIIYTQDFEKIATGQKEFPQHFPQSGWVEHHLEEIWASVEDALRVALSQAKERDQNFDPRKIVGIGITNQRETFGLWDRKTGQPCAPAIVWQCRRSSAICAALAKKPVGKKIVNITGLVLDPYFSGTKLKWLLDNHKDIKNRAIAGSLAFGTMDTFLIWKMTAGRSHATDATNASRTLLMDLRKQQWSDLCLKALGIPKSLLPKILDSNANFGVTEGMDLLPNGIPICGVLGDQHAALFGQECFLAGEAKVTFGTGAFFLLNTGAAAKKTRSGVSTLAWKVSGKATYALEGSVFIAGALVQWLRDQLKIVRSSSEVEALARQVPDSGGVFILPALSGLGAPYWKPEARGVIGGLSRGSSRAHIARAAHESIAFSVGEVFEELARDAGKRVRRIRVDGGASMNTLLLQTQADVLGVGIERPQDIESTALGAAYMAAVGAGLKTMSNLRGVNPVELRVSSLLKAREQKAQMMLWKRRMKALLAGCY